MVKCFCVSTSEDLGKRIEKWKKFISPSIIFQTAMENAIRDKEVYYGNLDDEPILDDIVKRLQQEMAECKADYFDKGKEMGVTWAKQASYKELCHVLRMRDQLEANDSFKMVFMLPGASHLC